MGDWGNKAAGITDLDMIRQLLDLSFKANLDTPAAARGSTTFEIAERGSAIEIDPKLLFGMRDGSATWPATQFLVLPKINWRSVLAAH